MKQLRAIGRALSALVAVLAIVMGVPIGLCRFVGWPLPHSIPSFGDVSSFLTQNGVPDAVLIDGLAIALWVLWSVFALSIVVESAAVVRGTTVRSFGGPLQIIAASLVATIVMALPTGGRSAVPSELPELSLIVTTEAMPALSVSPSATAAQAVVVPATPTTPSGPVYTVVRHDTLWDLAQQYLGDPERWHEIFDLNRGNPQSDGRSLVDGNRIYPGWKLQLPTDATYAAEPVSQSVPVPVAPVVATPQPPAVAPPADVSPPAQVLMTAPVDVVDEQVHEVVQDGPSSVITFASGAMVGATFASGISAAVAMLRKRRRRLAGISSLTTDEVRVDALITQSVQDLRRHDLESLASTDQSNDDASPAQAFEPGCVAVGVRGSDELSLDLTNVGALSVTGEDASAFVRSMLLSFISNCAPVDAEVMIVGSSLAASLLGDIEPFPGLRIENDVAALVSELNVEHVRRTRLLDEEDYEDIAAFRRANPGEPVTALLFVIDGADAGLETLSRLIESQARLGIGAVLLNGDGRNTIVVRDAVVESSTHFEIVGARTFRLDRDDALSMARVLQASRVDVPETLVPLSTVVEPIDDEVPSVVEDLVPGREETAIAESPDSIEAVVRCQLFGSWKLLHNGEEVTAFTPQMRETMALLALHCEGISPEALGVSLWPDSNRRVVNERVRNALARINTALRTATGMKDVVFVDRVNGRHRLDPALVSCDVWEFESALREAAAERDAIGQLRSVARVFDRLVPDVTWPWVELLREDMERRGRNALARLAELLEGAGLTAEAADAYEQAIRLDGSNEEVHRRLMRLRASEGQVDAALQVYRRLERVLRDLDLNPTAETVTLVDELTRRRAS